MRLMLSYVPGVIFKLPADKPADKQTPSDNEENDMLVCPLSMVTAPRYCVQERCMFWVNTPPPSCLLKAYLHLKSLLVHAEYSNIVKDAEFTSLVKKRKDPLSFG